MSLRNQSALGIPSHALCSTKPFFRHSSLPANSHSRLRSCTGLQVALALLVQLESLVELLVGSPCDARGNTIVFCLVPTTQLHQQHNCMGHHVDLRWLVGWAAVSAVLLASSVGTLW